MINKEAIDRLIGLRISYKIRIEEEDIEALDMAIKALELQSSFINELKDLKEKTESYLKTINDELDWFGENKE